VAKKVIVAKVSGIELPDWEEQNGYILTALEGTSIDLDYIKSVTTTTLFPEYFTRILYLSLAVEIAPGLGVSVAQIERIQEELYRANLEAIALDEHKKYVKESSTEWVDAGR